MVGSVGAGMTILSLTTIWQVFSGIVVYTLVGLTAFATVVGILWGAACLIGAVVDMKESKDRS